MKVVVGFMSVVRLGSQCDLSVCERKSWIAGLDAAFILGVVSGRVMADNGCTICDFILAINTIVGP